MGERDVLSLLIDASTRIEEEFASGRRRLSFPQYLELFATEPRRHGRDAARYLGDMIEFFGTEHVERPWGSCERYRLFEQAFAGAAVQNASALVGHEEVQQEFVRSIANFRREGRANRLVLIHGPNGSAKSTFARCVLQGLEYYSSLDEGALYRFHWVFPSKSMLRGHIGFSGRAATRQDGSYAHLAEEELDARLFIEVRDHPLFLIPIKQRKVLLAELQRRAGTTEAFSEWLLHGNLSQKSRQVFDALLSSYGGSLQEVLRHVQVERYYISRRYRVGAVTIGPELSVDAGERQITADRSVAALPASLQSQSLYEIFGELIDAAGGVVEFSDLLKRPLDSFKYLHGALETSEVALRSQSVQLNSVFLGSANEGHLAAFREHPEFESFRGRLELIRMGYLRSWSEEQRIYDEQVIPQIRKHVAPHATRIAAKFAVLTRLLRPASEKYPKRLAELVAELSVFEKAELYATGSAPARVDQESAKLLRAAVGDLYREFDNTPVYEGISGASPREIRRVLLDASQNGAYGCLSPIAVLDELEKLCRRTSEYLWLQVDSEPGGFHDHQLMVRTLREQLLDWLEDEFRVASGIVEPARYSELFDRYVTHVSNWVKGELVTNPLTGANEPADESLMKEVEQMLGVEGVPDSYRRELMNRVAAWAIERPEQPLRQEEIFDSELRKLRQSAFADRKVALARLCDDVLTLLREDGRGLDAKRKRNALATWRRLREEFGYVESSVIDAAQILMETRFRQGVP